MRRESRSSSPAIRRRGRSRISKSGCRAASNPVSIDGNSPSRDVASPRDSRLQGEGAGLRSAARGRAVGGEKVVSSVRELEGALHRLVAACRWSRRTLDLGFAKEVLRPMLRTPPARTIEQVQRMVAERFRVKPEDLVRRGPHDRVSPPAAGGDVSRRKRTQATYDGDCRRLRRARSLDDHVRRQVRRSAPPRKSRSSPFSWISSPRSWRRREKASFRLHARAQRPCRSPAAGSRSVSQILFRSISCRAMTVRWISLVPSPISMSGASR